MATVPVPHHWLAGDPMNSARMNEIRDQINWMVNPPLVHLRRRNSAQSISAGGGVWTKISFDTVVSDPYDMYDAGTPDTLTVNTPGWYSCELVLSFAGKGTDTRFIMGLYKNGFTADELLVRYDQETLPNSVSTFRKESMLFFNVGDFMHLAAYIDVTTSNTNASSDAECPQLRIRWIST